MYSQGLWLSYFTLFIRHLDKAPLKSYATAKSTQPEFSLYVKSPEFYS